MNLAELLSGIGRGAEDVGHVAGAVLEPLGKRTAEVVSGEAPELDRERRQQAQQLSDEQRELKANELESQLAMGQKYGTLTPQQQKQYVDAITGLYSQPGQQESLLRRIHKAIHPNGTVRQATQPLANPTPQGGTARTDVDLLDEKQGLRPVPGVHPFQNKEDGQWYQPMYNRMGQVVNELVEGYTPPASKMGAGKTPPTPGNQLPADAVGPDGNPIPESARTVGQSYIGYEGKWYPAPKPKPIFKTIKGHSVLVDQAGNILRDLGPVGASKVTSHQVPFLGDDGQMHLLTTYSVSTPQGETISVEAPPPDTGQSEPNQSPTQKKPPPKKAGALLPRTGAKTPTMGPAIPGSRAWAASKSLTGRADEATLAALEKQAAQDKEAADFYAQAYNQPGNKSAFDTSLITDYTSILAKGGRKTQAEIAFAQKIGGLGLRTEALIQKASTGELPDDVRKMYLNYLNQRSQEEQIEVNNLKNQLGGQTSPNPAAPAANASDPLGIF